MKLGSLIPEVNILCLKLHDSRPPQANFLKKGTFLFQEYTISLREHYPHFKILKCELWSPPPLNSKNVATLPFQSEKSEKIVPPPFCKGDEGMIEGVRGTSIGVGRVVTYV